MKKELYIQIPEPCHEDWNKMTPVDQGRYCQSCCKEVVDFSAMTDQEIISFLSKPRGKTCGNFSSDQLNRIITEPATPAKKKFWVMMLSFLLPFVFSIKGKAQFRKKKTADTTQTSNTRVPNRPTLGKVAVTKCIVEPVTQLRGDTIVEEGVRKNYEISGKVTDEKGYALEGVVIAIEGSNRKTVTNQDGKFIILANGNVTLAFTSVGFETRKQLMNAESAEQSLLVRLTPVTSVDNVLTVGLFVSRETVDDPGTQMINLKGTVIDTSGIPIPSASIELMGTRQGTSANANGFFTLNISKEKKLQVKVSAIGFQTKEITLTSEESKQKQSIILTPQVKLLDDVVVVSSGSNIVGNYRLGGYWTGVRIRKSVIDTVIDLVKPTVLKVYPNPVSKNSFVNITLSQKGIYQLKLTDNQGKLIQQTLFVISAKNMAYQLELPQSIAAGIYYISVVEATSHKQYTEKLIVQ